jgi:hypothetical protein
MIFVKRNENIVRDSRFLPIALYWRHPGMRGAEMIRPTTANTSISFPDTLRLHIAAPATSG